MTIRSQDLPAFLDAVFSLEGQASETSSTAKVAGDERARVLWGCAGLEVVRPLYLSAVLAQRSMACHDRAGVTAEPAEREVAPLLLCGSLLLNSAYRVASGEGSDAALHLSAAVRFATEGRLDFVQVARDGGDIDDIARAGERAMGPLWTLRIASLGGSPPTELEEGVGRTLGRISIARDLVEGGAARLQRAMGGGSDRAAARLSLQPIRSALPAWEAEALEQASPLTLTKKAEVRRAVAQCA